MTHPPSKHPKDWVKATTPHGTALATVINGQWVDMYYNPITVTAWVEI